MAQKRWSNHPEAATVSTTGFIHTVSKLWLLLVLNNGFRYNDLKEQGVMTWNSKTQGFSSVLDLFKIFTVI